MKVTTVAERGLRLPIGSIKPDGTLSQEFTLRPYKSKIDRHLGLWREANESQYGDDAGQLLARLTAKFVSMILETAGGAPVPHSADGDSTPEAEAAIAGWPLMDVMYVYYFARIKALGEKFRIMTACPRDKKQCGWSGSMTLDLGSADVSYAETPADLDLWVKLQEPFKARDGQTKISSVRLGPVRWSAMMRPGVITGKVGNLSYQSLMDAIYGINDDTNRPYDIQEEELDEMAKIDMVRIDKAAERASCGLNLRTVVQCPKCGAAITDPLNWSYDYFFVDSVPLET